MCEGKGLFENHNLQNLSILEPNPIRPATDCCSVKSVFAVCKYAQVQTDIQKMISVCVCMYMCVCALRCTDMAKIHACLCQTCGRHGHNFMCVRHFIFQFEHIPDKYETQLSSKLKEKKMEGQKFWKSMMHVGEPQAE